ncbi:MAG: hypothetical protein WDO13_04105 [Verrucomicrobiota bacterium]
MREDYAAAHRVDFAASLPDPDAPKLDGFWTPSEPAVIVADRVFRELLQDAMKEPHHAVPGPLARRRPGLAGLGRLPAR